MHSVPPRLQALYDAATRIGRELGRSPEGVFDPCGLILEIPPVSGHYWCTPKDAETFASTGGDGVHYSYLPQPSDGTDLEPIVMTLPANDLHNFVVAEGFAEFLGLGFYVGWFALEQIAYDPDGVISYFGKYDAEDPDYKTVRMKAIREYLKIAHIPLNLGRVHALTAKYSPHLIVPDEPP